MTQQELDETKYGLIQRFSLTYVVEKPAKGVALFNVRGRRESWWKNQTRNVAAYAKRWACPQ